MQYVRNTFDSVSTAWNSINPATLSGAIDVVVVEHDDGTLQCSPFHVRFGKFSLLRPSEKKVEFQVNGAKQDYAMKLGDGGEAFFVFETSDTIPQSLRTSPLASPVSSPSLSPSESTLPVLQDPEPLDLDGGDIERPQRRPGMSVILSNNNNNNNNSNTSHDDDALQLPASRGRSNSGNWPTPSIPYRPHSEGILRKPARPDRLDGAEEGSTENISQRSNSPPPLTPKEAYERAIALSRELSAANIPSHVTSTGDLMLDMTSYKSNDDDAALRAEIFARKILSEEMDGNYDIGSLFGVDEHGNLWIYSSQDAKEAAMKKSLQGPLPTRSATIAADAASDPGYQSDGSDVTTAPVPQHRRAGSDLGPLDLDMPTDSDVPRTAGDPNRNYAKTLRLTSDQLKALKLKPGVNSMSFTVNRATCHAYMYLWRYDAPVVISDIDGTITKSDALGHVMNMIGRDWTHSGIARLYSDISANGYNIMYLTSRSVGLADGTRAYLNGIVQNGYRLPRGPTILSPDRTMAALRREIYLRKPHIFKMATLRDIRNLYPQSGRPFHAGFGNRLTDQISYRTVDVPRSRIFTINANAEVSLDLLSLNKLKLSYVNINEVVDHYFPPASTLVKGGGEEFTDFTYWRDVPLDLDDFSASEEDDEAREEVEDGADADDEEGDDGDEVLGESYISRDSLDGSILSGSMEGEEQMMMSSIIEDIDEADGEYDEEIDEEDDDVEEEDGGVHISQPLEAEKLDNTAAAADADHEDKGVRVLLEDVGAELITGVKNLSLEKETVKP